MSERVRVRVNQTAAGVGEIGVVYDADDSPLLRGMARHGVVTLTEIEPEPGGLRSGRLPDTDTDESFEVDPVDLDDDGPEG